MIVLIDNHDSFTFNLYHTLAIHGAVVQVVRNDAITVDALVAMADRGALDGLVIGPGPADPPRAGVSLAAIEALSGVVPVLGVCLGHQAIAHVHGARVARAARPMHGKTSAIHHDGRGVFNGASQPMTVMRYHSLAVERATLPSSLELSAWTDEGDVMGVRVRDVDVEGVQFHPESVLTVEGPALLGRWLDRCNKGRLEECA